MLKLEATLIPTTAVQPGTGGWSAERGVDFVVFLTNRIRVGGVPAGQTRIVAAEPVSFMEADEIPAEGAPAIRRYVGLAARATQAAAEDPAERRLTQAWSSVARKAEGS